MRGTVDWESIVPAAPIVPNLMMFHPLARAPAPRACVIGTRARVDGPIIGRCLRQHHVHASRIPAECLTGDLAQGRQTLRANLRSTASRKGTETNGVVPSASTDICALRISGPAGVGLCGRCTHGAGVAEGHTLTVGQWARCAVGETMSA